MKIFPEAKDSNRARIADLDRFLIKQFGPAPSMRRPVSGKLISCFSSFSFFFFFQIVPIEPSRLCRPFHPHSLLSDCRSVQVGCTRFSRCCYLISDLCSPFRRELVQALSQSPDLGGRARLFGYYLSFFLLSFFLLFPVFDREISSQDRLGTTIANSLDP